MLCETAELGGHGGQNTAPALHRMGGLGRRAVFYGGQAVESRRASKILLPLHREHGLSRSTEWGEGWGTRFWLLNRCGGRPLQRDNGELSWSRRGSPNAAPAAAGARF